MTDFRTHFKEACQAKFKELGRKLLFGEVLDLAALSHQACLPVAPQLPVKAQKRETTIAAGADQVYALYPLKVGKEAALRAISVQLKKHELSYLLDKTNQFALAVKSWPTAYRYFQDGGDRCPHPATFFSQGRYADDPSTWKRHGARTAANHQYIPPREPEGWRDAFPDFTDRDKRWDQLQPAQHQFIINALALGNLASEPIKEDDKLIRFRTA